MRIFAYNIIIMVGKGTITMRETRILEFKETITNTFLKTVSAFRITMVEQFFLGLMIMEM